MLSKVCQLYVNLNCKEEEIIMKSRQVPRLYFRRVGMGWGFLVYTWGSQPPSANAVGRLDRGTPT
eukprot:3535208-Amphidinium_carterae.1